MKQFKKQLFLALLVFCVVGSGKALENEASLTPTAVIENAFKNGSSGIQVLQIGAVISMLKDDLKGDAHQRFIVRLSNGQTLLIAHNIDIAPRVPNLKIGKSVKFYGEYEWNSKGGVIHWTHHDPQGRHINGWIEYKGKKYG